MLTITNLTKNEILSLINQAIKLKEGKTKLKNNKSIANIFMEPSTRTKISFEKAERDLGMDIYNLTFSDSSFKKKESLYDTICTLKQYNINNFVIRSNEECYWDNLKSVNNIKIINAGDGKLHHPTQALLDAMTIYEHFNTLDNLKILICGDVNNSRVYHSFAKLMEQFNSKILLSAPRELQNKKITYVDFNKTLPNVDVVMMLRIQHERHKMQFDQTKYNSKFGINENNISKLKTNAILMHPGPINRDVEISANIKYDHPKNKILEQVKNGLYIRKIILGMI